MCEVLPSPGPCAQLTHRGAKWQSATLRTSTKMYRNVMLRHGLALLALRPAEGGDVAVSHGQRVWVHTALGETVWHATMHAVFSSVEAARSLPFCYSWTDSEDEPSTIGSIGEEPAWRKNKI